MLIRTTQIVTGLTGCSLLGERRERSFRRISIDSRKTRPGDLFLALKGGRHDGHDFVQEAYQEGAKGFVVSGPIAGMDSRMQVFAVPDTRVALQELAARARTDFQGSVLGITGSNGKTTTKEMAANILSVRFKVHRNPGNHNNLIGLPLSILEMKKGAEWMVLEMGSNARGEISALSRIARPHWAIIINVSEVHLQGLGNLLGVLKEKSSILDGLEPGGTLIVNGDDPSLKSAVRGADAKCVTFGLRNSNDVFPADYSVRGDGKVSFCVGKGPRIDLPVIGFYSLHNALAAYALGLRAGMGHEEIKEGLEKPIRQPMRMEVIRETGVTFIVDCYNANPRSVYLAAETLSLMGGEGKKVLVLGDMNELGEGSARLHRELGKRLSLLDLGAVLTVGELAAMAGRAIRDEDQRRGRQRVVVEASGFAGACRRLVRLLEEGDLVLFKASRGVQMEKLFEMTRSQMREGRSRR